MGVGAKLGERAKNLRERWSTWLRARELSWQAVAQRRGGHTTPGKRSLFRWSSPTIDVVVDEVAVHVDIYVEQSGQSAIYYTRFRANYLLGVGPAFRIKKTHFGGSIGKALGFEDVELGDPDFDRIYFVRSAHPEATRTAWSGVDKKRLVDFANVYTRIISKGEEVSLLIYGTMTDENDLDDCIDIVGGIAAYGADWLTPIRGLPKAHWMPPQGPWDERTTPCSTLEVRGAQVWIHPQLVGLGIGASATVLSNRDLQVLSFICDDQGVPQEVELPQGFLGGSQLLPSLGPARIEHDGRHVRVILSGELTTHRLLTSADVATSIALGSSSLGAYR